MAETGVQAAVFESAVDGLGRSFRRRLSPQALEELRRLGIDFDRVQPAYPLEAWEQALRVVARTLYSGEADEAALRRLGREFMEGYTETVLGKASLALGRVIGPQRFLGRLGRNFRSAGNFATITVQNTSPNEVTIVSALEPQFLAKWKNRTTVMHYYRLGVLEAAFAVMGLQGEVELLHLDPELQVARYHVRWR